MKAAKGLTLMETLIALAILGIAFSALLMSQIGNLRSSTQARWRSEAKAAAIQVLEQRISEILRIEPSADPRYQDKGSDSYWFIDYYYGCPTKVNPPSSTRGGSQSNLRAVTCSGAQSIGDIATSWSVAGEAGRLGEGLIAVQVTATHPRGPSVALLDYVSCYDVYPSPTVDTPIPCPVPTNTGGGR